MNWKLPNQLTLARLALALIFFALLAWYDAPSPRLLNACFIIYIIAGITDILDGYLARLWKITSAFGRITDPFVDKVLVCGAYALLAGSNFAFPQVPGIPDWERNLPHWLTGHMASSVQAWMVVVVIAREFIVSGVRGYSESVGRKFPATIWGKLKMFGQSVAICAVLYQQANLPQTTWTIVLKLSAVWLSVIFTVISGFAYVNRARRLFAVTEEGEGGA
jgi:phosphatidylglycerophosphate synthase